MSLVRKLEPFDSIKNKETKCLSLEQNLEMNISACR